MRAAIMITSASSAISPNTQSTPRSLTDEHPISLGPWKSGKLADLVLWKPSLFGAKPEMVIKGGFIACKQMGHPDASIPTPQPVFMRPMFGSFGQASSRCSIAFVSQLCRAKGWHSNTVLRKNSKRCAGVEKSKNTI